MAHGLWTGTISFGLVNIPVSLHSAETHDKLSFHMLDKTDMSPVKYKLVNANSEKEITRKQTVKGYEYKKGDYVIVGDEDFKKANVKATKTIDIQAFVKTEEIHPEFFEKPYYIQATDKAMKSYALLREALKRSGRVGVAKIVMSGREHLCAVIVRDEVLILELLRFAHALTKPDKKSVPPSDLKKLGVKENEIKMAEQLIDQMTESFRPEQFKDEYQNDLMNFIKNKIKHGDHAKGREVEPDESEDATEGKMGDVIDFMSLLKKSVARSGTKAGRTGRGKSSARA